MITQKYINQLSYKIIGCAIEVHRALVPGLLESVYERCLKHELICSGLDVQSQLRVPVIYKGIEVDCDLRLDLLVNDLVVVELKSVEIMIPVFKAQLLTYLKLLEKPKELLINFNCENLKENLISLVSPTFAILSKE